MFHGLNVTKKVGRFQRFFFFFENFEFSTAIHDFSEETTKKYLSAEVEYTYINDFLKLLAQWNILGPASQACRTAGTVLAYESNINITFMEKWIFSKGEYMQQHVFGIFKMENLGKNLIWQFSANICPILKILLKFFCQNSFNVIYETNIFSRTPYVCPYW